MTHFQEGDLRIQTNSGTASPTEVLTNAIEDLGGETDHLMTHFQEGVGKWRKQNEDFMGK
jgi:DNA-directed RNA polymerase subunit L